MSAAAVEVGPAQAVGANASPRFVRRLLRRRLAVACLAYITVVIGIAIVAPIALPNVAEENAGDLAQIAQGPSGAHLLGTDTLGRDVLERLLVGSRVTIVGVAEALLVVLALGVPLGLAAGFYGGWIDRVVSWLADLTFSIPAIVIILVVLSVFPQNMTAAMATLGVIAAPGLMRVVRSATLPVRAELYIAAARVSGLSRPYIVVRHVLPRIAGVVIVQASLLAAVALLVQTGLAFLNLVVAAPAPSWGGMVADGVSAITRQSWLIWPPGIAIALTILALGLLGDAVRDATTEGWSAPVRRRRGRAVRPAGTARSAPPVERDALLSVEGLRVAFGPPGASVTVVDDVTFAIDAGETVGVVGESGCGKTATAMAILGLLAGTGRIEAGAIRLTGRDLTALSERELHAIRGSEIALISQEPMVGLNPAFRVGWQLAKVVRRHHGLSRAAARRRAVELLASVHLADPEAVATRYPHELSGGMAQRVAIARALAGEPRLLIADEPTTALDVTVQAEILDLLREIQRERGMAILLVTHDWGVVADMCDRAVVMYAGQIVERAVLAPLFRQPLHPYTEALLASNPQAVAETELLPMIPGAVPRPGEWPRGCHFHPRCRYATDACRDLAIPLERVGSGRETRCIHHDQLVAAP
ncbi:MAG: peptide/nickel transport system ATP-binding protein [Solirubrobacteraceae bacterium]